MDVLIHKSVLDKLKKLLAMQIGMIKEWCINNDIPPKYFQAYVWDDPTVKALQAKIVDIIALMPPQPQTIIIPKGYTFNGIL